MGIKPIGLSKPSKPRSWNPREFWERRNKILICRNYGGIGDILMHRLMFEDIKKTHPDFKLVFACPPEFHPLVQDHPFLDEVLDIEKTNIQDYVVSYNTSTACGIYENAVAPLADKHRSDIWANHCGIELTSHNMHIRLTEEEKNWGFAKLKELNPDPSTPSVLFAPVSKIMTKNLLEPQVETIAKAVRSKGGYLFCPNNLPIPALRNYSIDVVTKTNLRQWMSLMFAADYCISVDTAAFHLAGGMGKPLMSIFTWADGKVYGKYYQQVLVQKHRDNGDWDCGPCYNWSKCPKSDSVLCKPCLTQITPEMLTEGVERLFKRWPWGQRKVVKVQMSQEKI